MKLYTKLLLAVAAFIAAGSFQTRGDDGGSASVTGRYWFDQEKNMKPFTPGNLSIPVGELPDGIHVFNAQVTKNGIPSSPVARWFVKTSQANPASSMEVEFEIDGKPWQTVRSSVSDNLLSLSLDASALPEGFHYLHGRVNIEGNHSATYGRMFIKTLGLHTGSEYRIVSFIDGLPFKTVSQIATADGALSVPLDMNEVSLGLHSLQLQISGPSGVPSAVRQTLFMRVPTAGQLATMEGFYMLDGRQGGTMTPTLDGNTYHLDLDVSSLTSGLHTLAFYMASPEGLITSMENAWFIKTPHGGEGVKRYEYWINDNIEAARSVTLDKVANPLQILSLVDIPQEPFRTSSFTFAIENNIPVIYPKQDFQIRFLDPDERITSAISPFTDTRDRRPVTEMTPVLNPKSSFRENIGEGDIKWYTIQAEQGDSLAFRLSGAGMAELFGPDGKLLGEKSGVDATNTMGATLRSNGTYYLAVHDISSSSRNVDVAIDLIPRFAILEFTPESSSNEDLLLATLKGNGFDLLQDLCLTSENGIIKCDEIVKIDNYECLAVFRLDDHPENIGSYSFVGTFKDEEKGGTQTVTSFNTLNISEGTDVNIAVTIDAPRIARTPYEVNIIVENKSNRGYYGIPVNMAVKDFSDGGRIEMMNFGLARNREDAPSPYYHTDNLLGSGESGVFLPMILPYLAPYEKKTYTIGYISKPHEILTMYAWNGTPWSEDAKVIKSKEEWTVEEVEPLLEHNYLSLFDVMDLYNAVINDEDVIGNSMYPDEETENSAKVSVKRAPGDNPPRHGLGDAADAALTVCKSSVYAGGAIGNWVNGQRLSHTQAVLEAAGYTMGDDIYQSSGLADLDNMNRAMMNVGNDLMEAGSTNNNAIGNAQSLYHLANARNRWHAAFHRPNPQPSKIDCYQSGDPNEMFGYQSPSGENSIGIDITEVTYTIEFENDPEIANAAATRIKVTNVPDGKALDLKSFVPKKMIIGDKEVNLPASHHFVKTLDMRPSINSVAELTFDYDEYSGEAEWSIVTLDPMTLEPTRYMDDGVLPVNDHSGRGVGFLTYTIALRPGLAHDTEIENQAVIIFDDNVPIPTPVCRNVTDYRRPEAEIVGIENDEDMNFWFEIDSSDEGSGIWYYELYMNRQGTDEWLLVMSQIMEDSFFFSSETPLPGANFAIVAVDRAGNRQNVPFLNSMSGDADGNGSVDANDVVLTRNYYMGKAISINKENADVTMDGVIDTQDATGIRNIYLDHKAKVKRQRIYRRK